MDKRVRKRIINYHWHDQRLYFKGLFVLKLEERMALIIQMHEDLGHSGKQKTLVEICRRYFWHNRTEDVKRVVRMCQQCQMVRKVGNICCEDEELKNISICKLFYRVVMDIAGPLLETKSRKKNNSGCHQSLLEVVRSKSCCLPWC